MATADISMQILLQPRILHMNSLGYTVRGLCSGGPRAQELIARGFPLDLVPMARELSPLHDLVSLVKLWRYFRRLRPAIVFTHTPKAGILGPVAARLAGVPYVVHVIHGYFVHDRAPLAAKIFGWLMEKHTSLWSHFCLCQSREDLVQGVRYGIIGKKRLKYLGNGVDVKEFDPAGISGKERTALKERFGIPGNALVFGFVGRLVKEKGIRELFLAIPEVLKQAGNAFFIIAGPVETEQSDAISAEEIADAKQRYPVAFPGFCNTRDLLAVLDFFVLPTYREGVPRVLMEASAMQVPCIATNVRGCREVVINGVTGFLVEPRSGADLARGICKVIALSPPQRQAIGLAGRTHISRNFNQARVFKRFRKICDVLLRNVSNGRTGGVSSY
jgi:glycosyltransferase involved in cell wall biosynthesis